MSEQIGPLDNLSFTVRSLRQLVALADTQARCLAKTCAEIRDAGVPAIPAFQQPGLFDVHRCSAIISVSVLPSGKKAVVQDFFIFENDVP